ncbi:cold shock domain-containing protein [Rubrivirga sp. S365]|uniref:cold shock domain-containing protein n=1 Tax=Rubrivirga sp. S365 TaxID=3076080 RepID=UPI0028C576F5|nr:cold shock domain-containing protein [Rubrivirga sp. S365]MDT7858041.1 cold shock domain-containing protein [Rubrivirga sp. S365]
MSTPDLHTGTVEWFDVERDLGLASCDDGSLPCTVHGRSARASGVPTLAVGDRVGFRVRGEGGHRTAYDLTRLSSPRGRLGDGGALPPAA